MRRAEQTAPLHAFYDEQAIQTLNTTQYMGAVSNEMNAMLTQLPPGFNDEQKISDIDMINNLAILAPREHKNLMIEQGFDPRTATIETYVEICERAETKEDAHKETKMRKNARLASDHDNSDSSY
jgi:AAA+ superfamily predicted ATPase